MYDHCITLGDFHCLYRGASKFGVSWSEYVTMETDKNKNENLLLEIR